MDAEIQKKLREKFDSQRIGKKPKITCPACSKAKGVCNEHKKVRCPPAPAGCGQWISERHMHVDFVSHADVTDRLLDVDPDWDWEPVAFGPDGLPVFDSNGGLWIRLTIGGKTRLGYGGADGKSGEDAVKETIGDAIKVAAMRFGVGLDLWRKGEAPGKPHEDEPASPPVGRGEQPRNGAPQQRNGTVRPAQSAEQEPDPEAEKARADLRAKVKAAGIDGEALAARFEQQYGESLRLCRSAPRIEAFAKLQNLSAASRVGAANGTSQ